MSLLPLSSIASLTSLHLHLRYPSALALEIGTGIISTEVTSIMKTITKLQFLQHLEVTDLGLDNKTLSEVCYLGNLKSVIWRTHRVFEEHGTKKQSGGRFYE